LTVNICPAIVAVPDLGAPVFSWIASLTEPFPVPALPESTASQGTLAEAVQPHPAGAVTLTLVDPAAAGTETRSGEIANEQLSACETVNVRPPIVSVP
jgi:hypothetical protein